MTHSTCAQSIEHNLLANWKVVLSSFFPDNASIEIKLGNDILVGVNRQMGR